MSDKVIEGYPLSLQQRRVWSLWPADPRASAVLALEIEGSLDVDRLSRAAEALVARHEILRTTFHRRPGMRYPFQVIAETGGISWETIAAPGPDSAAIAEELAARASRAFDLERGPALRLRFASLSSTRHVLVVVLPALCADGPTLRLVARQLISLYSGQSSAEEESPIQYADYAQWQSDILEASDERAEAGRAYWRGRPSGADARLPFETIAGDRLHSGSSVFSLEAERVAGIERFCGSVGLSLPDFLLAAWQTLLWRTTGEPEIIVGVLHDGRTLQDLENATGLFATALPLIARFEERPRFAELVRKASEARKENAEWEDYFGTAETPRPSDRRPPGFEFLEWQEPWVHGGLRVSVLREFSPVERSPICLSAVRERDGTRLTVRNESDLLGVGAAVRLASHLQPLLIAAAENPEAKVLDLPLLDPSERRRLLVDWNRTGAETPQPRCIHELFEDQASRAPDAPALASGEQRVSFAELNERANALAWTLREKGIGLGARVGLALERSAEMIIALLGILKAGAAYVPLNPDHPATRLSLQLAQSGSRLVITRSEWLEKFEEFDGETLLLDGKLSTARDPRNPPRSAGPDDLVYVMSTSGSTGVPKAVAIRHESLVNYTNFVLRDLLRFEPAGAEPLAFATVSTINADLGNTSIFPSLVSGGLLHVVPYEATMEGSAFGMYAARHGVDVLKIVPSHMSALLSSGGGSAVLPRRCLILGGETLSWELVDRIRSLDGTCEIVNHYGPTETTVGSLTYRIGAEAQRPPSSTVPIGRPIANTEVYLLDEAREPVPVGVAGELYIGGVGLAQGYYGQPGETAERFVPHRFSDARDARLYRTGDRARYLPDGNVEFLGRVDDQVKIRGFRIEPSEVRAVLAAHASVREAVVVAREDSPNERRLVAYVVPSRGTRVSAEELRAWLRRQVPDYMIPSAYVTMKAFPLTPNGKLDRDQLPAPENARGERPYVAPRTEAERVIAEIWAEVLKLERVGVDDDFFELGGHSLLVTQIVSRMRKALERELPIRWVFESPTVSALAARIEVTEREDLARILDELERGSEERAEKLEIPDEPPVGV